MKVIKYKDLLKLLKTKKLKIIIEKRKEKGLYMYGARNHAEFISYINESDYDPWDIIIPGYSINLPKDRYFMSNDIIAIYELPNNNHKFFMRINYPDYNEEKALKDIKSYVDSYEKTHNFNKSTKLRFI